MTATLDKATQSTIAIAEAGNANAAAKLAVRRHSWSETVACALAKVKVAKRRRATKPEYV